MRSIYSILSPHFQPVGNSGRPGNSTQPTTGILHAATRSVLDPCHSRLALICAALFCVSVEATATEATLIWADNSTNETGFRLERAIGAGAYVTLATTAANVTTYTDTTLAASTTYHYRVLAFNAMGDSEPSNIADLTLPANPTANTAPTIAPITSPTINAGTSTAALAFTIADAETAVASLTLTGASSNLSLVSVSAIVFGGSGANRTVTVTPVSGQSGTATISVTVSDGTLIGLSVFTLTVTAANQAPTISALAGQTIAEDTSTTTLAFSVADAETASASLTVSAGSSNLALVSNAGITLGGSGGNRTIKITPAANQSGSAVITVTVSDGSKSTSTVFTVTVTAVNDAPTISSVANQTIAQDTATNALAFSIGDQETPASSLTMSGTSSNSALVPVAAIAFGGSGANRTVIVTPATGISGTATITLTVRDGGLGSSTTFVVTVTAVAQSNTAPAISNITGQTIGAGTSTSALTFTINDAETTATSLTVSRTSSNVALVPLTAVVFGGSGTNRTATVTPTAGMSGTTTITISVNDGSLTSSSSFVVTVTATASSNTAPTISPISDQNVTQDGSTTSLSFTVGDGESAAGSLIVTATSSNPGLIPESNIAVAGTGTNRTVTAVPVASQAGTAIITIFVTDGTNITTTSFTVTVAALAAVPEARMLNLSTRVVCRPNLDMLIPGFVITGPTNRQVLLRAVGPTLGGEPFNVPGTLPNPRLILKHWNGSAYVDLASNDDWGSNPNAAAIQQISAQVSAFPLAPNSRDAALLVDLAPGRYTLFVDDAAQGDGIVIVEFYDAESTANGTGFVNMSNRGHVGVGAEVMISGFVVASEGAKTLLIRAVGPTLGAAPFNVANTLGDPIMDLYRREEDGSDTLVLTQDNWSEGSDPARVAQMASAASAFPLPADSKDAALVATLEPGVYTVVVRGVNGATGTTLVELYQVE